jgi:undecaprenyl-diphosphatase
MVFADRLFTTLDATEVEVVARAVSSCERMRLTRLARAATRLGNGWLYPILSALIVLTDVDRPFRFLASAAISVVLALAVYPVLKRALARTRPCDYDPSLARDLAPLDHYSCPSGHAMTAAAYAVPMIFAWPIAAPLALGLCLIVSWSRVALGHHYVSDVVLGTILGASIAASVGAIVY